MLCWRVEKNGWELEKIALGKRMVQFGTEKKAKKKEDKLKILKIGLGNIQIYYQSES